MPSSAKTLFLTSAFAILAQHRHHHESAMNGSGSHNNMVMALVPTRHYDSKRTRSSSRSSVLEWHLRVISSPPSHRTNKDRRDDIGGDDSDDSNSMDHLHQTSNRAHPTSSDPTERKEEGELEELPYGVFASKRENPRGTYSALFLEDNGLELMKDENGILTARPRRQVHTESGGGGVDEEHEPNEETAAKTKTDKTESATIADISVDALNGEEISIDRDEEDEIHTKQRRKSHTKRAITDHPAIPVPETGFNVILTHCTADFDSLASAVGLAKLWSLEHDHQHHEAVPPQSHTQDGVQPSNQTRPDANSFDNSFDSASHVPTFVVLPRGAHPGVQRFLALHKHLFPIRSLKSLPTDLSGLNRLALVDAQRRERLGPAEPLLQYAKRVTVVDHHIDQDSDIKATDYVVDKVGSVTTLIVERLQKAQVELTEAEATLLALGVHADTGSLCFDSTTTRDAYAIAWCLSQGASQAAIAEHAQSSLSPEQQGVLTQALMNSNSTIVHGVTVSTVLLSADGFINGLAAVTQDALELSSSDIFLLSLVYEAQAGGKKRKRKQQEIAGFLTSPFSPVP